MRKLMMSLAAAVLVVLAPLAQAADAPVGANDMQALRDALRSDKRAFVARTLALTPAQDKKFWPVYDAYQRALANVARARALTAETLLGHDSKVNGASAKALVNQNVEADDAEMRARRRMVKGSMAALPPVTAARYIQLEAKFRAVQAYDVAQAFPLVQ